MSLTALAPGPLATVQDLGRAGLRACGVPVGGAFDRGALALANAILGNDPGASAIELTGFGGTWEARAPLAVALAGAPMTAAIRREGTPDRACPVPGATTLRPGDRLVIGASALGHRAYLAVRGGWLTPLRSGSRSDRRPLAAGDVLPATSGETAGLRPSPSLIRPRRDGAIRILPGPDASPEALAWLAAGPFRVLPESDRVGLRLDGEPSPLPADPERLSAPVALGAIQVAGGRPIVLGPDCGTMGGYPHVGQVISADLDRLAQIRPGDEVRFRGVRRDVARALDRRRRAALGRACLILRARALGPA